MVEPIDVIDVSAFSIDICEFPNKRSISIVTGLLQRSRFDLADNPNLMASRNKSLRMDR